MNRPHLYTPPYRYEILILATLPESASGYPGWHIDHFGNVWRFKAYANENPPQENAEFFKRRGFALFDAEWDILEDVLRHAL